FLCPPVPDGEDKKARFRHPLATSSIAPAHTTPRRNMVRSSDGDCRSDGATPSVIVLQGEGEALCPEGRTCPGHGRTSHPVIHVVELVAGPNHVAEVKEVVPNQGAGV